MHINSEDISEHGDAVDVCIIGAGAAGISMAVRLAEQGHRVLSARVAMLATASVLRTATGVKRSAILIFPCMALACAI